MIGDLKGMDRRTSRGLRTAIRSLTKNPERGKPLAYDLAGHLSIQALRAKYRIVYRIEHEVVVVVVVMVGRRLPGSDRDVYQELARMLTDEDAGA